MMRPDKPFKVALTGTARLFLSAAPSGLTITLAARGGRLTMRLHWRKFGRLVAALAFSRMAGRVVILTDGAVSLSIYPLGPSRLRIVANCHETGDWVRSELNGHTVWTLLSALPELAERGAGIPARETRLVLRDLETGKAVVE